jgi:uncharacterized protein involved in exopolysaccharide biosynthesis/Mrp family chromosome partitioning ATPase
MDQMDSKMLTVRDVLKILFKEKWVVVITFVVTLLMLWFGFQFKTYVFEAETKMLVTAKKLIESSYYRDLVDFRRADIVLTQSEIVTSTPVLERVVTNLGLQHRPKDYERKFASRIKIVVGDFVLRVNSAVKSVYALFRKIKPVGEDSEQVKVLRAIEDLKKNIKIEAVKDTDIFVIKVKDYDPIAAAVIANVVSRSYVIFDLEQQLAEVQTKFGEKHLTYTQLNDTVSKLIANLSGEKLSTVDVIGPASVKIIDQANIPLNPAGKPRILFYVIGAILGFILGVVLTFVMNYLDQTFKSVEEIQEFLGIPVVGSLPRRKHHGLIADTDDFDLKKAFNSLTDQLFLLFKESKVQSFVFASLDSQAENAAVVANIGAYLAQRIPGKLLLIDANLRKPCLHEIFKISEGPGLAEVIKGDVSLEKAVYAINARLDVLPSGKSITNPLEVLSSPDLPLLFDQLKIKYQFILIHSADLKHYQDVGFLSFLIPHIILSVSEGKTRRQAVRASVNHLKKLSCRFSGVILKDRVFALPERIYRRV